MLYSSKGLSKSMRSIRCCSYIFIWCAISSLKDYSYFWWAAISSLHFAITVFSSLEIASLIASYCCFALFLSFSSYLLRCSMLPTLACCILYSYSIFSLALLRSCCSLPLILSPSLRIRLASWFLWQPLMRHSGQMKASLQVLQTYMMGSSACQLHVLYKSLSKPLLAVLLSYLISIYRLCTCCCLFEALLAEMTDSMSYLYSSWSISVISWQRLQ